MAQKLTFIEFFKCPAALSKVKSVSMNILSELLAGARQIRTPLAVGYVWLLVAWINVTHAPANLRHADLFTRATQDLKHLSPAIVIVIISCLAYLIGLFFELFDDLLVKVGFAIVAGSVIVLIVLFVALLAIAFWWVTATLALLVIVGFILSIRGTTKRVESAVRRWALRGLLLFSHITYRVLSAVRRVWSNANPVRNDLVAESIINLLDEHPETLDSFFETLSIYSLRSACYELVRGISRSGSEYRSRDGKLNNISRIVVQSPMDPTSANLLREYLAQRWTASREIRKTIVIRVMNVSDVRDLVNRAIENAIGHVQAESPSVFDSYDRLRSESELRCGVSVPLGVALSCAASYLFSDAWLIPAAVPAIFVYFSGMKKQEEAMSIIVRSIAAQITPIDLNVNDVRLLSWPIQGLRHRSKILSKLRSRIRQVGSSGKRTSEESTGAGKSAAPDI